MEKNIRKPKLVRITTLPVSMKVLLKGQMKFMQQSGFDVTMISAAGDEVESLKEQENCEHFSVPLNRNISPVKDFVCLVQLYFLLRKIKPDIVHTHTPKAGLIGMWAAKLAGVPVRLHTIAGLPWMEYFGMMKKVLIAVEKLTASAAHAVFPNSKIQDAFLKKNGIAIPKLKVLGNGSSNGIDLQHFCLSEQIKNNALALRSSSDVSENDFVWIFAGRLVKDKGIGELLVAFKNLLAEFPNDKLWLLGDEEPLLDPLTKEQQQMIHQHPSVKAWGFVKDLRSHLAAADILVFPSYREGFPNVPMQAGALGCAMILSDINGCNEIVEDGINGKLIPVKNADALYDAMLILRKSPAVRKKYSLAMLENIQQFSQRKLWNIILEEYKSWLAKTKRPLPVN